MTDAVATTNWYYDAASRVTSIVAPQGAVGYTYNNADQRASMVLPGSRTATYAYDTAGRLASITDWQSRVIGFSYNADGRRTGITRPNGVNSTYAYDVAGRLNSVVHANAGGTLQSFTYALDAVGNRTSVTSLTGTENYTLAALNRLTNVTYPNGDVVGYTYDANGNRLTKTFNGTPTNYTYDNADQLTGDGTLAYTYDANGNTTSVGADTFTWDYANRMGGATVGGTATNYAYDGDDARVQKTVSGTPTNYVWDREDGFPLLVDDGTNAFLHDDGTLAQINGAGTPEYLLDDALGSRRGVTNLAGTLTGTADYDTFGAVRASTGAGSAFGYTGEQFDAETGYMYLRARYLNPALGRFTSADSVQPNSPGTQGYNLYAYVANNPTTWVDPSGHCGCDIVESIPSIQSLTAIIMAYGVEVIPLGECVLIGLALCVLPVAIGALVCALTPSCIEGAMDLADILLDLGSGVWDGLEWTWETLKDVLENWPDIPNVAKTVLDVVGDCLSDEQCRTLVIDTVGLLASATGVVSCAIAFVPPATPVAAGVCVASLYISGSSAYANLLLNCPCENTASFRVSVALAGCSYIPLVGLSCYAASVYRDIQVNRPGFDGDSNH